MHRNQRSEIAAGTKKNQTVDSHGGSGWPARNRHDIDCTFVTVTNGRILGPDA